jgi:hypothetical protein
MLDRDTGLVITEDWPEGEEAMLRETDKAEEMDMRLDGGTETDEDGLLEEATPDETLDLPMTEETKELDTAKLRELLGLFDGRDEPTNELGGELEIEAGATKEMSNDNQGRTC